MLNGLEKLKQAEDRIKRLDGKNVKIKFDVDSSGIEKAQDSLKQAFNGGVNGGSNGSGGTATGNNMVKGVRGYFTEYNKAIKAGFKAVEKSISAGEKTHLKGILDKQAQEYFKEADRIRELAQKNLGDKFKNFDKASQNALTTARTESEKRQEALRALQLDRAEQQRNREQERIAKQEIREQERIAKQEAREQERVAKQEARESAQVKAIENKHQRAIAENALRNQNLYRNAERNYIGKNNASSGYIGTFENSREYLRAGGDAYNKTINGYLNNENIPQSERDNFQQKIDFTESANKAKDDIKAEGVAYKYASGQADLYTKELNGLYASYTRLTKQAIKANVGSKEQGFLYDQAKAIRDEYNALRAEVEPTLSVGQMAQLDYMEQKSDLSLREAAVTRQASIDAGITNLNYKNILDSQRRINSLELERSKISEKEADVYGKYTDAITNAKNEQQGMITNYGTMSADQQAQLENLQKEGIYRKQNYETLHQIGELDKQIGENSFIAKINANSKMKGVYKDEISEIKGLYANAKNTTDMQYASKREQELFARAAASNNTGLSFIDKFKNGISSFTTMLLGPMALFRYGMTAAKAVVSNVTQMDAAMTELYKVTDNSKNEYEKFQEATKKTSDEIGSTQVALVQSTATFARLGYNLTDSAELGKNASLFSNVGDEGMTSTEAAEDMVAIMKGFNVQAEDSIHIVDALNQVGKLVA